MAAAKIQAFPSIRSRPATLKTKKAAVIAPSTNPARASDRECACSTTRDTETIAAMPVPHANAKQRARQERCDAIRPCSEGKTSVAIAACPLKPLKSNPRMPKPQARKTSLLTATVMATQPSAAAHRQATHRIDCDDHSQPKIAMAQGSSVAESPMAVMQDQKFTLDHLRQR